MKIRIARGCLPTATLLKNALLAAGARVDVNDQAVVCWGAGTDQSPALNGRCSDYNKLEQLQVLRDAGITVPPFSQAANPSLLIAFARKLQHSRGRDIEPCFILDDMERRVAPDTYFTKFIPSVAEYRVWIYRRQHLGTYRKTLRHPETRRGFGRNHGNGYAFELMRAADIPRGAVDKAAASVEALGLDFGAVDIIESTTPEYVVLEVNTAPGADNEDRQGFGSLVRKIARWEELGYPRRRGAAA